MKTEALHIDGVEFLSRKDVMAMFGISTVTLSKWTSKGILRHHTIGKRVYFVESEICEDIKNTGSQVRKSHKEKVS